MCTHVIQFCSTDDRAPGTDDIAQSALSSDCAVYSIQSVCKGESIRLDSREVAKMFLMLGGGAGEGVVAPHAPAPLTPPTGGTAQGGQATGELLHFQNEREADFVRFKEGHGTAPEKPVTCELPLQHGHPRSAAPTPSPSLDMAMPPDDHDIGSKLWTSGLAGTALRPIEDVPGFGPPPPYERDQGAGLGAGATACCPQWQTPSTGGLHHGPLPSQMVPRGWGPAFRGERDHTLAARRRLEVSGLKRRHPEPDGAAHSHVFEKFRLVDRSAEMKRKLGVYGGNGRSGGPRVTSYSLSVAAGARKPAPRPKSTQFGQKRSPGAPVSRSLAFRDNRNLSLAEDACRAAQLASGDGFPRAGGIPTPMASAPNEHKPHWELNSRQSAPEALPRTEGGLLAEFPMPGQLEAVAEAIRFEEFPDGTHCFSYDGVYEEGGHGTAPWCRPGDCFRRPGDSSCFGAQPGAVPAEAPRAPPGNSAAEHVLGPQASRLHSGSLPPAKHEAGARRAGRARFQR